MDKQPDGQVLANFRFPVERGKVAEFARAGRTPHPLFLDRDAAVEAGLRDCVAPITFPSTFVLHMGTDAAVMELMERLEMNPARSVHGEIQFHKHLDIHVGDVLEATLLVSSDEVRTSASGARRRFVRMDLILRNQEGKKVSSTENTFIETLGNE